MNTPSASEVRLNGGAAPCFVAAAWQPAPGQPPGACPWGGMRGSTGTISALMVGGWAPDSSDDCCAGRMRPSAGPDAVATGRGWLGGKPGLGPDA
jgi:hypothetical protein